MAMSAPTEAQLELLRDKCVLWDRAAREGPMDLRDYNRRAADALKAVLSVVQAEAPHVRRDAHAGACECADCWQAMEGGAR
jgi:hypothetical protein